MVKLAATLMNIIPRSIALTAKGAGTVAISIAIVRITGLTGQRIRGKSANGLGMVKLAATLINTIPRSIALTAKGAGNVAISIAIVQITWR